MRMELLMEENVLKLGCGDFPGGPVAETPSSRCRGPGFHFWSGI